MRLFTDELKLSATDLVNHLACHHLTGLQRARLLDLIPDERLGGGQGFDLLAKFGDEHEQRVLDEYRASGAEVVEIQTGYGDWATVEQAAEATIAAMRDGAEVIFQATFIDGQWTGHADFLERVDADTDLGPWGYEPVDAKLARSAKVRAILQLGEYARAVDSVQGVSPRNVHLALGSGDRFTFPTSQIAPFHRRARSRLLTDLDRDLLAETYPDPCSYCAICRWSGRCEVRRRDDDHLSFVFGMRSDQIVRLSEAGIGTLSLLAGSAEVDCPEGFNADVFDRLLNQARLQVEARTADDLFEVLDPAERPDGGFARLSAPSEHDLFFDLEGNPFRGEQGIEYLWGISDRADEYEEWWAHSEAEERKVFEEVVDYMVANRRAHPDSHIYHYAAHEETTLKRLAGQYATRESAVDELLRGGALVDLYAVVLGAVRLSTESYSLKAVEAFYRPGDGRETEVKSGFESIIEYERWLATNDDTLLRGIADYNRDDCVSTRQLGDWLEERRTEAIEIWGEIPRPAAEEGAPPDSVDEREQRVEVIRSRLLAGLDQIDLTSLDVADDPDVAARWLLAYLLDFHRRNERSAWWWYFARLEMDDEELWNDSESIASLVYEGISGTVKRSKIHRFSFDPDQPYKLGVGSKPRDPATGEGAGAIHTLDPVEGWLEIKRATNSEKPLPDHLIPGPPLDAGVVKDAIEAVGDDVARHGFDGTQFSAIADLLLRREPRLEDDDLRSMAETTEPHERVVDAGLTLDDSYLPIQGPPGSGKTRNAARLIRELVAAGKKVAVCAQSHRVILNLLDEVVTPADEGDANGLRVLKIGGDEPENEHIEWRSSGGAGAVPDAIEADVVGATVWLLSQPDLRQHFDVLVIDEAGQYSLADTVAAATCARSIVLIGDPQQLEQPMPGTHPLGTGQSAMAHVLAGNATMPADRGIFLDRSWRMHPDLCDFVSELSYEGRLGSHPLCSDRSIDGVDHGLWWLSVDHEGNRSRSREEAAIVREVVDDLVGRTFTDHDGSTRSLGLDDVLVIAPFNAQVRELQHALPAGIQVGTVDLFQGRQAPVVIYSLASSSTADAPRGMGFLLSLNRLNVAVSRGQRLAVVVGNPALLDATPSEVEHIPLASAFCRLVEMASSQDRSSHVSST